MKSKGCLSYTGGVGNPHYISPNQEYVCSTGYRGPGGLQDETEVRQDYIDGPHLCEDIRLYPDGNLNASVCLLPSFLIYVSLKRLIIDGASIVMLTAYKIADF